MGEMADDALNEIANEDENYIRLQDIPDTELEEDDRQSKNGIPPFSMREILRWTASDR